MKRTANWLQLFVIGVIPLALTINTGCGGSGAVTLSPSGTTVGSVNLPVGSYDRIEFDLESGCGIGKSIDLVQYDR